jgi:ectoine hydroxylase-related dioxygenase (phytanoyl-CoA dioxygenase family)
VLGKIFSNIFPSYGNVISSRQKEFYDENGYLHLEQVLGEKILMSIQSSLEIWVEETIARWKDIYFADIDLSKLGFCTRLYEAWVLSNKPPLITASQAMNQSCPLIFDYMRYRLFILISRQLLDSKDAVPMESSFFRAKLPEQDYTSVPWHQDAQCIPSNFVTDFVTLWIPLVDINEGNACIEVAEMKLGGGLYKPCIPPGASYAGMRGRDIDSLANNRKILMRRGDILCMHKFLPHRSVHNDSKEIRWSLDLRYQKSDAVYQ